jgi:hypothetical protein
MQAFPLFSKKVYSIAVLTECNYAVLTECNYAVLFYVLALAVSKSLGTTASFESNFQ